MRKFLIATHGTFAGGIRSSLEMIIGPQEHIHLIQAYAEENKGLEDELETVLAGLSDDDELVVFTDLLGGSVTNQVLRYALKENVHIVSGINLPLLVEVLMADPEEPVKGVIAHAIQAARDQMVYVNDLVTSQQPDDFND
ncbi:PTS system, mannose-specific IIA component [Dyadobacter sp. SG02]|uniref:PTS sugar transporter subunit IIA n=1 Tax=Dyadobacter sp. SG02 TaxID=1855291 RepID=UPI0008BAF1AE|nr:PTS sugar transporter subunit IIA [Dyadobacter sp. SG02]SEI53712.1 PTS system, mannose-specific IIA component [Dyadobacter sp. SG02]